MKYIFSLILIFLSFIIFYKNVNGAACSSSSGSDFDCCQEGASTSGTKKTLSNTNESTRKCSWPADSTFQFTVVKFGLLPKGGTEADIVYRGASMVFNAGSVDAGATMGNFLAGANFPPGVYEALVPELLLSETVQSATAPTITYSATNYECSTNSVTHQQQPGEDEYMCVGQSTTGVDHNGDGSDNYNVSVGTFRSDYGPGGEVCFLDSDSDGDADTMRIFDNQLGDIVISSESTYTISFNFNTSDGVLYSVFQENGFGDISDPVACTAVDVGDLDVSIIKE